MELGRSRSLVVVDVDGGVHLDLDESFDGMALRSQRHVAQVEARPVLSRLLGGAGVGAGVGIFG